MKRKRLFSALMALAMILSLCTFASASGATPTTVALAPGSAKLGESAADLADDDHLTVSGIGDKEHQTVPAELAEAAISYAVTVQVTAASGTSPESRTASPAASQNMSITLKGATSASTTYTVAVNSSDTLDLAGTTAAVIEISDTNGVVAEVTVTPDGQSPLVKAAADGDTLAGEIKLGAAGAFRPDVAANSDGQLNDYAKASVSGDVTNEGPLPDDVINVKVPTAAQTKDAFDLYLDPHDLIATTRAQRYGSNISVTSGGRLYFKTTSGGAVSMASSSAPLTIVNKSNVKVSVDLSVEATKAVGSGGAFTFKNAAADVDSATGAAIYLALKSGTEEKAVSDTATNGKNTALIETSIDTGDWYDLAWHGAKDLGYYSYDMKSDLSAADDSSFESISFNLTGKINDDKAWDAISSFGLSVIWDVKAYAAPPEPTDPTATVGTPFSGAGSTLSIDLTWGTLAKAKTNAQLTITATGGDLTATATASDSVLTYTAPAAVLAYNKIQGSATVVFYNTAPTDADAVTVNLNVK